MLVTDRETPLSAQAERVLTALQAVGDQWLSRSQIAKQLNKSRLNPYELAALDLLVEQGKVEVQKQEKTGYIDFQWVYRAKM
jgi:hypothetical protein